MEELVWGALLGAAGIAVLYFVVKAAVKAAILEVQAEKKEEALKPESPAAENQRPETGPKEVETCASPKE